MATMFRHFSFDPVPRPAYAVYEAERAAMNVSPTSPALHLDHLSSRPPTPPCTMADLALQLNHQTLRIDTSLTCRSTGPPTPDSDCDKDQDASPVDCTQHDRPTYSRIAASVLRMQRQHNSRIQCTASHARDLSKLVKMIEEEKQCTVSAPSSTHPSCPSSPDDEGVDMDYDLPAKRIEAVIATPTWRATDWRESSVRITKQVRMRKRSKEHGVSKRSSSSSSSSSSS
jgi:hypothetical protein